ncbi:hypothetical protein ALP99_100697 [Pseudomonas syringae pv. tomato]|uniref:Uncharacterized protein n=5 Tax=Pseudomonas syringae group TaxID=136849 RepID=A0A0Q0AEK6_PSESX|nr:Unknown protein sequence [Pseudomonas syringae pv. maculicola]KPC06711.1 Unknown protein sequence [Pseudomonas amygdali pv. lachrymans]KPC08283.1 Unknown protein sequence [Pseudomonas syringae pv. maculicola str. M6]KPW31587.1 hypothetical protein ALO87_100665 [Pseudomonas syringae pv. apii]KPW44268.1 hypothetical protein ALO86_100538 [Pseudomonas syringae pv. berberidis]KPY19602.1 hypothetical protein ALO54_100616 [Pseudomonas syringae pv. philadelphi]KPY62375.1 hypothetical protein ALO94
MRPETRLIAEQTARDQCGQSMASSQSAVASRRYGRMLREQRLKP